MVTKIMKIIIFTPHSDSALVPSQSLPIWSVVLPQVATTETNGGQTGAVRLVSGKDKIMFTDVMKSFKGCTKLFKVRKKRRKD